MSVCPRGPSRVQQARQLEVVALEHLCGRVAHQTHTVVDADHQHQPVRTISEHLALPAQPQIACDVAAYTAIDPGNVPASVMESPANTTR